MIRPCLLFLLSLLVLASSPQAHAFDTVVIDAGHGGKDPGSAWHGLKEKNLCLDTAKRLNAALQALGFRTVMTRTDDVFVELDERARIANRHSDSIFVSIHYDASRDTSACGFETHFQSPRGKTLASSIQSAMKEALPGRSRGSKYQDLKVLRETKCVAVLVECGFISNKNDASDCGSARHRQNIASAIASGISAMRRKL